MARALKMVNDLEEAPTPHLNSNSGKLRMRRPFDTRVTHITRWIAESGKALQPDRSQVERFLHMLDPGAHFFSFRTFSDTPYTRLPGRDPLERAIHAPLERCWDELVALNQEGAAVAVTVNASNGRGRGVMDIVRIRALFLDDDDPGARTLPLEPPPGITVESSPGRYHHYWLVQGLAPEDFVSAQRGVADRYGGDARACALNQAMALPGFWRRKRLGWPYQVRLLRELAADSEEPEFRGGL